MGILVFYEGDGRIAGDLRRRHWRQLRRVLPLVFDWVNEYMRRPPAKIPAKLIPATFRLGSMLKDDAEKKEEINLLNVQEWNRFFAWCEFLGPLDDTYRIWEPAVKLFREQSRHPDEARKE